MAYYSSSFYEDDTGEYHWTPYTGSYDVVPYQASISCSASEFNEPKLIEYYPTTYVNGYDHSYDDVLYQASISYSDSEFHEPKLIDYYPITYDNGHDYSEINYSTYSFSEPKVIQYDGNGYFPSQTQYLISYSTSEFNVPDFVEYDPTPYDGGFDLTLTYGKPLPPSDEICYPRSTLESNGLSFDGFSYGSIPSPYGQGGTDDFSIKPRNESKPPNVSEGVPKSNGNGGDQLNGGDDKGHAPDLVEPLEYSNEGEEREGYTYDCDYPWSGYDYGGGNGRIGGYGYECDKLLPQTSYGYCSDTMDLCENLFGYWPCLSKKHSRSNGHEEVADEGCNDPWKGTADYLFGSPFDYGEQRDEGKYSMVSRYGHGSYYQQQPPCYGQEEYDENSRNHKFNIL